MGSEMCIRDRKHLDIDEDYYKSKYREPVSDLPSIPNQKFAKEMDGIFR